MGRKKLEIKRIENKSSRQVTFTKRRNGLIKKAKQLSILCDVDVAVLISSARGRLYDFCSTTSLTDILQRYISYAGEGVNLSTEICIMEEGSSRFSSFLTVRELLETVERQLEEPDVDQLSTTDFVLLEKQLEAALLETRSRKMRLMMETKISLEQKEKMLVEENKLLKEEIAVNNSNMKMNEMRTEFGNLQSQTQHAIIKFI